MTVKGAKLTIEADADGDGQTETGVFDMGVDVETTTTFRTGYLVGGRGSTANAVFGDLVGDGESQYQGVFLGFGGGVKVVEVTFRNYKGSTHQWGNTGNGGTKADATGEDAITQADVLSKYIEAADLDSRGPATLEHGEYSKSGRYSPDKVALEQPSFKRNWEEDGNWFSGTLTCPLAADLTQAWDAQKRTPD